MPTRSSKYLDMNQLAARTLRIATGEEEREPALTLKQVSGRKGGLVGGKSRMSSLTKEQRSELGKQAREARTIKEALASFEASANANCQLNKVN